MAKTPISKKVIYSDFRKDLKTSPVNNDIVRITNEEAVKESIRNIVMTDFGEHPMRPNFGCGVKSMLFQNYTPDAFLVMEDLVTTAINNYEPRCNLIEVVVSGNVDTHSVTITVVFNVINTEKPVTLEIQLERVR